MRNPILLLMISSILLFLIGFGLSKIMIYFKDINNFEVIKNYKEL